MNWYLVNCHKISTLMPAHASLSISTGTDQFFTMLLQLFTAGLSQARLQALVLQLLLEFLKLLHADSTLLQLTDAASLSSQLNLQPQ